MIKSSRVSVGTEAVQFNIPEAIDSITGQTIAIRNMNASETVYLGGSDVDVYSGFPLYAGEQISLELQLPQDVYGVSTSAGEVAILWLDLK